MVIQHNMSALYANSSLGTVTGLQQKTTEKLSTGYQINRAGDDAAGLTISEKMRYQIRGLNKAGNNVQDGISYCQVADGALAETQEMLHRMTELCVQASNDSLTPQDREAIHKEIAQLKLEMARIFDTTSFNGEEIWQKEPDSKVEIPGATQYAVEANLYSRNLNVTQANSRVLSKDNKYTISADATDVKVSWIGNDGNNYEVAQSFEDFKANPVIDFNNTKNATTGVSAPIATNYSFSISSDATDEEIIEAVNGKQFSTSSTVYIGLSSNTAGVHFSNISLNLEDAYRSSADATADHPLNFDSYSVETLTPPQTTANDSSTNQNNLTTSNSVPAWTYTFYMDGIGTVTATSNATMTYNATNTNGEKGVWWYTDRNGDHNYSYPRYPVEIPATPAGLADAVNGNNTTNSPGLLTKQSMGGEITVGFQLTDPSGKDIGSFTMDVDYTSGDSAATFQSKVAAALNSATMRATPTGYLNDTITFYSASPNKKIPQYDKQISLNIQAGYTEGQGLAIQYTSMSLASLGIENATTLTYENAQNALTASYKALDKVSEQRSSFGAYINRLEHIYANDTNTAENSQAAESRIRDTDYASEMIAYSAQSIIAQAGQSMLSMTNSNPQHILDLLQ